MSERVPPHDERSEQSVIGAVFIKPSVFEQLAPQLQVDDFFMPAHREIWDAMLDLHKRRRAIDPVTVADKLKVAGQLAKLDGGQLYLMTCMNETPTAENVEHYANIVSEKATLRRLLATAAEVQSACYGDIGDVGDFLREAMGKVSRVVVSDESSKSQSLQEIHDKLIGDIEQIQLGKKLACVPTGLAAIDDLLGGGMYPEWLIVPCAQTSIGKTSLGIQIAYRNAEQHGIPTLIFSPEMTKRQMFVKGACNLSRINTHTFDPPKPGGKADWDAIREAGSRALELGDLIRIEEHRKFGQLVAVAHAWRARHPGLAMIMVDGIQKIEGVRAKNDNRQEEVRGVAAGLKNLAKDLKVPVVAVSQLDNDSTKEKRAPKIGDMRDSKAIEHEADVIIGLWRDRMQPRGRCEVILLKNRGGEVKKRIFQWVGEWQGIDPRTTSDPDDKD